MKTKLQFPRWLMTLMLMISALGAWSQVGGLTQTGDMTVCINSTESYGVVATAGSTYAWSIIAGTGGAGTIINGAAPNNVISVNWTSSGTSTLQVIETNSSLCVGVPVNILVTVTPLNTIALSSAVGTNAQTVCVNTAITNITYATTGATGATFAGLPAGVTGSWAGNVVTISGTPTAAGAAQTYTVTLTGGCGVITTTGTIAVTANNTVTRSSAVGTDAQTVYINTAITNITYATTGATGATVTGLPTGVTGSWAANVVSISGTPTTIAGSPFTYTVTTTGGCGGTATTGTITVLPDNTLILSSAASTDAQTVYINTPVINITYATTGATGATVTGLPAGVIGTWAANVVTISGTPTTTTGSPFTYTVTTTGGSGAISTTGTITVLPDNTLILSSAAGTNAQTVYINTPVINITYATTGATGATVTGLPAGVTGSWAANVVTISGTPTTITGSPFTYTVTTTGGSGAISTTGTITVLPNNTLTLSSAVGTNAQTVCINNAVTNITYTTTGATGATVTGLPAGVTGSWAGNVVTISGTPTTASGSPFTYTVTTTGGSGSITTTGTIAVTPDNTVTLSSAGGTNAQTVCINNAVTNITYATTGATGATVTGLPAGVTGSWAANVVTISGTPSTSVGSPFNYTVTLTGGCGTVTANGNINVIPLPTTSPIFHN